MRKRNQLVASLVMAWSLVGCGGGGGTTSETTSTDVTSGTTSGGTTSGTVGCGSGYQTTALNMQDGTVKICGEINFYDDGGANNNYSAGNFFDRKEYTLTLKPATPGKKVSVEVDSLDIEQGYDFLKFYNGDSTSTGYIGALRYDFDSDPSKSTVITSTAADGSLTIHWSSDFSNTQPGWVAKISQVDSVEYLTMRDSNYTMEPDHNVTFIDIGGENIGYDQRAISTYPSSIYRALTIYPSSPGKKVSVELDSYDIEQGYDSLKFYNGNSTSADYIGALRYKFTSDPSKSTVITSTAADGSLTIELTVDVNEYVHGEEGWIGTISEVDSVEYLTMRDSSYTMEPDHNVTFYDIGGENAGYDQKTQFSSSYTTYRALTIYPSSPGKKVSVTLDSLDIEEGWDELNVYNGPSTSDELLSNLYTGFNTSTTFTSTADDGSLTFELTVDVSDYVHGEQGWIGSISEQ